MRTFMLCPSLHFQIGERTRTVTCGMDEKLQEQLAALKDLAKTRAEFAQKHRLILDSVLLIIDEKDALKASENERGEPQPR